MPAPHPARSLPESERVEYLTVIAAVVSADQDVATKELTGIRELCRELGLSDAGEAQVIAAAEKPDQAGVDAILGKLQKKLALKVSLITDAIVIVFADGKVDPGESREIARMGRALDIDPAQIGLIGRYVESVILGRAGQEDEQELSRALGLGVAAEMKADTGPGAAVRWLHKIFHRS